MNDHPPVSGWKLRVHGHFHFTSLWIEKHFLYRFQYAVLPITSISYPKYAQKSRTIAKVDTPNDGRFL